MLHRATRFHPLAGFALARLTLTKFTLTRPALAVIAAAALLALVPIVAAPVFAATAVANAGTTARDDAQLSAQRERFLAARSALARGDEALFRRLADTLGDYPLHRYLRYLWLERRIASGEGGEAVAAFAAAAPKDHLSRKLMGRWQRQLSDAGKWREYLRVSQLPGGVAIPCRALEARHALGEIADFSADTGRLWVEDDGRPGPCTRVFTVLLAPASEGAAAPEPPIALVWQRIYRLMAAGSVGRVDELLKHLNRRDRGWVELWQRGYREPLPALADERLEADTPLTRRIVMHLIRRHALADLGDAHQRWQGLRGQYQFSAADLADIDRRLALTAAYRGRDFALEWLEALPPAARDERTRAWRVRAALRQRDWAAAKRALDALEAGEQADRQWRYWRARTLQAMGEHGAARALYKVIAERSSYYGFLAADRLDQPYVIRDQRLRLDAPLRARLLARDDIRAAREYYLVGLAAQARRAWNAAVRQLAEDARLGAAVLAHQWGWHDRAVWTAAQTSHRNDYALRFPTPWDEQVSAASRDHALEAAWIYGVMRRESAFMADVRSSAGAVGLMQLMPRTAQFVGEKIGRPVSTAELTDAALNIRLGSYYLNHVRERFGHPALATAAYNAGPRRVQGWLPKEGELDADIWVDTIPFTETRRYVRAVMAYTTVFQWRLSQRTTPLAERMPAIGG